MTRVRIHVTGIVQGVGFRPFIYGLAVRHGVSGFCYNDSEGVVIEAESPDDRAVERFAFDVKASPPPLARIDGFTVTGIAGTEHASGFAIRESRAAGEDEDVGRFALISPDISICADCLSELFDPTDRRRLYPFINCTNCGPRYSIIKDIPYDRPLTTMAVFPMCRDCEGEYADPADRRFHAQPNACERCGPRVWLAAEGTAGTGDDEVNYAAIEKAQELLRDGAILAVKGLGGFHLACDASNDDAVARLRDRKRRSLKKGRMSLKPFAVMVPDIASARRIARVDEAEEALLSGTVRPIVLLDRAGRDAGQAISVHVAPASPSVGVMLPYTPLHYLLFHTPTRERVFDALVMTSGNISEEPIVISNEEAVEKLSPIADGFLLHDRDIYMRVDDSIARVERGRPRVLRRARGYVPHPVQLASTGPAVAAFGPHLKNTLCITRGSNAIMGQHMGDLENVETMAFAEETLVNLTNTFHVRPDTVAHDMHPDYLSTRMARDWAALASVPGERVFAVQHHHAHVAACMAEHGLAGPVIGVAFDGTGYGTDGTVWGGEFLLSDLRGFVRAAHLAPVSLPGGDRAAREPWRCALSYLRHAYGPEALSGAASEIIGRVGEGRARTVISMMEAGLNSPLTSSAGRLFDAVASILGLVDEITFEAEAAIRLEGSADMDNPLSLRACTSDIIEGTPLIVDHAPLVRSVVEDLRAGVDGPVISARFHRGLACSIIETVRRLSVASGTIDVVLSGGVFQNRTLAGLVVEGLKGAGLKAWTHERVPPNDGGVALGQAVVASAILKGE